MYETSLLYWIAIEVAYLCQWNKMSPPILLSLSLSLSFSLFLSLSRHFANVLLGDTDSFQVNHVYKDANTYTVVSAASEVLGECVCVCVCVC